MLQSRNKCKTTVHLYSPTMHCKNLLKTSVCDDHHNYLWFLNSLCSIEAFRSEELINHCVKMCSTRPKTNLEQSVWKSSSLSRTTPTSTGQSMLLCSGHRVSYFLWTKIGTIKQKIKKNLFRGSFFSQSWTLKDFSLLPPPGFPSSWESRRATNCWPCIGTEVDALMGKFVCLPSRSAPENTGSPPWVLWADRPSGLPSQPWKPRQTRKNRSAAGPGIPPHCLGQKSMLSKAIKKCSGWISFSRGKGISRKLGIQHLGKCRKTKEGVRTKVNTPEGGQNNLRSNRPWGTGSLVQNWQNENRVPRKFKSMGHTCVPSERD